MSCDGSGLRRDKRLGIEGRQGGVGGRFAPATVGAAGGGMPFMIVGVKWESE